MAAKKLTKAKLPPMLSRTIVEKALPDAKSRERCKMEVRQLGD